MFIRGRNQSDPPLYNYKVFIEFEDGARRSEHPVIHHTSQDSSFAIRMKIFEHHLLTHVKVDCPRTMIL